MKKNSASVHFRTGRMDSAYAAGVASSTTRIVETMLAVSELSRYGVMLPANTSLYCVKVGLKIQVGGLLAATVSCLNPVSTIQITGKTNSRPTAQASTVHAAVLRTRRRR